MLKIRVLQENSKKNAHSAWAGSDPRMSGKAPPRGGFSERVGELPDRLSPTYPAEAPKLPKRRDPPAPCLLDTKPPAVPCRVLACALTLCPPCRAERCFFWSGVAVQCKKNPLQLARSKRARLCATVFLFWCVC